jgi:two-component system phosphate regulon sensor histidine kinase PhoR
MLSFKTKIFIAYIFITIFFLLLIFPFSNYFVHHTLSKMMKDRTSELLENIQNAPTNEALIRRLKEQKFQIFFRVSIINDRHQVLYDSHTKKILGPKFSQEYIMKHPEVVEAFEVEEAFNIDYSNLLGQKFYYYAKRFNFHDKNYVIRTALPHSYVTGLAEDFNLGFILLISAILFFFSIMAWFIISHFTRPIQQIIESIRPYQNGQVETLPTVEVSTHNDQDEFYQLSNTLNSLSTRIQEHINRLVEEKNERATILDSLVEGVVAIDDNFQVTFANDVAVEMLRCEKDHLIGKAFSTIPNNDLHIELLKKSLSEKSTQTRLLKFTEAGQKMFLNIIAIPRVETGGSILVIQDQSSHYRMIEMRKEFIANASHELKTPITIIRGFAEALHDNPEMPQKTQAIVTEKIVRNCGRMTHLIKDLLALADIEHISHSKLLDCELSYLLEDCKYTVESIYPDAKIHIDNRVEDNVFIIGEGNLLEQAFHNLINNAAKYSTPPADITVTLEQTDDSVIVSIADKGLGIPEEDLPHIFQRFYTVDKAHSQKMGGSGLGLSIVETIISKHAGTIDVSSVFGEGTTFKVTLPKDMRSICNEES